MKTPLSRTLVLAAAVLAATGAPAHARSEPGPAPSRGQLLYETHCIECHNAQMHWRALRQANDWESLRWQVRRWQETARLGWDESDIDEVAGYLNETIYRFPRTVDRARSSVTRDSPAR